MNFERMAGPFPIPTATARLGGGVASVLSSRITGVSVAVWKPLVSGSDFGDSTHCARCVAVTMTCWRNERRTSARPW